MPKHVIDILSNSGKHIDLALFYTEGSFVVAADAAENSEAPYQLMEASEYEYQLPQEYHLKADTLIRPSAANNSYGRIITGNYVGGTRMYVCDADEHEIAFVDFEIRSSKTGYRDDYRTMLAEITEYYTDLVLSSSSPVTQKFAPSDKNDPQTLYQKFAFVRSVIESEEFAEAIYKIQANPVRSWTEITEDRSINAVKRLSRANVRQLSASPNRVALPEGKTVAGLTTLPRTLTVRRKTDTVDTPENRFIKYVLTTFHSFCNSFLSFSNSSERLKKEASECCTKLEAWLGCMFFKEIGNPQFVALNSPVLQRRDGYREVLRAWTLFDLAAVLTWSGGEDVYRGGMKNVAMLYEYWLFFKLKEIISQQFHIDPADKSSLVKTDENGIHLDLKQGRMVTVEGKYTAGTRPLNVRFSYNRTFSHTSDFHNAGSWTLPMRPDYTLSVWPTSAKSEADAESTNSIVHVHFDAKYRVTELLALGNFKDDELAAEKEEESKGIYKRADLLKMHAYNDAIRRTSGSYILYPGDTPKQLSGFTELIPGLGAFPVRPDRFNLDSRAISKFIGELIEHFQNRISQREQRAVKDHEILRNKPQVLTVDMPEMNVADTNVLVAYYRDAAHLQWILSNRRYNARSGDAHGSLRITPEIASAKYILLHNEKYPDEQYFLKLGSLGPRFMDVDSMTQKEINPLGYTPRHDFYVVFELEEDAPSQDYIGMNWDIQKMFASGKFGSDKAYPVGIKISELMEYKN